MLFRAVAGVGKFWETSSGGRLVDPGVKWLIARGEGAPGSAWRICGRYDFGPIAAWSSILQREARLPSRCINGVQLVRTTGRKTYPVDLWVRKPGLISSPPAAT